MTTATVPADLTTSFLVAPFYVANHGCYAAVVEGDVWVYPIGGGQVEWDNGGPAEDSADGADELLAEVTAEAHRQGYMGPVRLTAGL